MKRLFVLVAFLITLLIVGSSVSAYSGEVGTGDTSAPVLIANDHPPSSGGYLNGVQRVNLTLYNADFKNPITVWEQSIDATFYPALSRYSDGTYKYSDSRYVECRDGSGNLIGHATFGYQAVSSSTPPGATLASVLVYLNYDDDFKTGILTYSGDVLIYLVDTSDSNWYLWGLNNLSMYNAFGAYTSVADAIKYLDGTGAGSSAYPHIALFGSKGTTRYEYVRGQTPGSGCPVAEYWQYYSLKFRNLYDVTKDTSTGIISVAVTKTVDGDPYASQVYITRGGLTKTKLWEEGGITEEDLDLDIVYGFPLEIDVLDYGGNWWNTSTFYDEPEINDYYIHVDNSTVTVGQSISASVTSATDPTLASLNYINWLYTNEGSSTQYSWGYLGVTNHSMKFSKISGFWWGWNSDTSTYSVAVGTTPPNPVTISFPSTGNKTLYAVLKDTTETQHVLIQPMTVIGTGYLNYIFHIKDRDTGAFINGAELDLQNLGTGTWYNSTLPTGIGSQVFPAGTNVFYRGSASEYVASTGTTSSVVDNSVTVINLAKNLTTGFANETLLYAGTYDNINKMWIPDVSVTYSYTYNGSAYSFTSMTNPSGYDQALVPQSTRVKLVCVKSGYAPATQYVDIGTADTQDVVVYMVPSAYATTPTTIPVTSPTPTGVPTTGVAGNYTGFWAPFYSAFSNMGASNLELPIIMTGFLAVLGLLFGAAITNSSPAGATAGAALGVLISAAIWIPLTYLVVICVILIFVWIFFIR